MSPGSPSFQPQKSSSPVQLGETSNANFVCSASGLWTVDDSASSSRCLMFSDRLLEMHKQDPQMLKDFVDNTVMKGLHGENIMIQDDQFSHLLPFRTPADHNCLCHSIPIALWGTKDKDLQLRKAIQMNMEGDGEATQYFRKQWMHMSRERDHDAFGMEIERSAEQWEQEWCEEVALVKDPSRDLSEIHVFVLAHVVRRPIIVYSPGFHKDSEGLAMAPIYFGGMYLPLLLKADNCSSQCPVLLAYLKAHFTALIPTQAPNGRPTLAPLVDVNGKYLPIQFVDQGIFAPGGALWRKLLRKYLSLHESAEGSQPPQLAVQLTTATISTLENQILWNYERKPPVAIPTLPPLSMPRLPSSNPPSARQVPPPDIHRTPREQFDDGRHGESPKLRMSGSRSSSPALLPARYGQTSSFIRAKSSQGVSPLNLESLAQLASSPNITPRLAPESPDNPASPIMPMPPYNPHRHTRSPSPSISTAYPLPRSSFSPTYNGSLPSPTHPPAAHSWLPFMPAESPGTGSNRSRNPTPSGRRISVTSTSSAQLPNRTTGSKASSSHMLNRTSSMSNNKGNTATTPPAGNSIPPASHRSRSPVVHPKSASRPGPGSPTFMPHNSFTRSPSPAQRMSPILTSWPPPQRVATSPYRAA